MLLYYVMYGQSWNFSYQYAIQCLFLIVKKVSHSDHLS